MAGWNGQIEDPVLVSATVFVIQLGCSASRGVARLTLSYRTRLVLWGFSPLGPGPTLRALAPRPSALRCGAVGRWGFRWGASVFLGKYCLCVAFVIA